MDSGLIRKYIELRESKENTKKKLGEITAELEEVSELIFFTMASEDIPSAAVNEGAKTVTVTPTVTPNSSIVHSEKFLAYCRTTFREIGGRKVSLLTLLYTMGVNPKRLTAFVDALFMQDEEVPFVHTFLKTGVKWRKSDNG
jgi:hypothetical protein